MKALSLRQPWAWLVVHGGKAVENRLWNTRFRGEFLIHAAKGMTVHEYVGAIEFAEQRGHPIAKHVPPFTTLARGGIIGIARLVDTIEPDGLLRCTERSDTIAAWHMHEQHGFLLEDVRPTPFIPCQGMLNFFNPPKDVVTRALAFAGHTAFCGPVTCASGACSCACHGATP